MKESDMHKPLKALNPSHHKKFIIGNQICILHCIQHLLLYIVKTSRLVKEMTTYEAYRLLLVLVSQLGTSLHRR